MRNTRTTVIHRIPITKARVNLGQVVRRAHLNKEYFILEKDGIPVAGLMDADQLEDYLELRDPKIRRQIEQSEEEYRAGKGRPLEEFLSELGPGTRPRSKAVRRQQV